MILAGVDGYKDGWVVASRQDQGDVSVTVLPDFKAILAGPYDVIAVDIPIGLVDGKRPCDVEAKRVLGTRGCCVFHAPLRSTIGAADYDEAKRICVSLGADKLSIQSWCIVPKIREVDGAIAPADQRRVYEVHPEVTFSQMNDGSPLLVKKSTRVGKELRRRLIKSAMGLDPIDFTLRGTRARRVGVDDIYDAIAALWSAERIARGSAHSLPSQPSLDPKGLQVAIWC